MKKTLFWTFGSALLGASLVITGCNGKDGGDTAHTDDHTDETTPGDDTGTAGGDDTSTPGGDDTSTPTGDDTATTGGDDTATTGGDDTATTGGDDTATTGGDDTATTGGDDTGTAGATIYDVQTGVHGIGSSVTLEGVVAADANGSGFFLLDGAGGPYSGVWVYYGGAPGKAIYEPVRGDWVQLTGLVDEYASDKSGETLTEILIEDDADIALVKSDQPLPAPEVVSTANLADPKTAEPYESVLITVEDVIVTDADVGFGEWIVDGSAVVDDLLFDAQAEFELLEKDTFESITGPLYYSFGYYKLVPRDVDDLVGHVGYEPPCKADKCGPDLVAGDLVITEVMQNPDAVGDDSGEYFEIYNATGGTVDLQALTFSDDGSDSFTVSGELIVAAGAYVVFSNNEDVKTNGGITVDYDYGGSMSLGNGDDELYASYSGLVIDSILWDGGSLWPDPTGASMNLSSDAIDAIDNDDGGSWCKASSTSVSGNLGTPGAANDLCEADPEPTYTSADVQDILDANCSGCHIGGGSSGGLTLDDVNDSVDEPSDDVPSMDRIEPGDTSNSYIWHKLNNTQGDVGGAGNWMPNGTTTGLDSADLAVIETWIDEGAPE